MAKRIVCSNCRYSFVPRVEGKVPERCPYCDKEETLRPVKTMQEWIDDVTNELE